MENIKTAVDVNQSRSCFIPTYSLLCHFQALLRPYCVIFQTLLMLYLGSAYSFFSLTLSFFGYVLSFSSFLFIRISGLSNYSSFRWLYRKKYAIISGKYCKNTYFRWLYRKNYSITSGNLLSNHCDWMAAIWNLALYLCIS